MPYKEFAQQFKDIFAQSKMQYSQKRKQSNPEMSIRIVSTRYVRYKMLLR